MKHLIENNMLQAETLNATHKKHFVESKDGTLISYEVIGKGPGLIIIPGVMTVADHYSGLANELSSSFTVYTIERRGRGRSGPQGKHYTLQSEVEDVLSLQGLTLAPYLFGHSYGGLIALETALAQSFNKVAVYEPGVSIDASLKKNWIGAYENHLSNSEHLSALALTLQSIGSKPLQMLPLWAMKLYLQTTLSQQKLVQLYQLLPANLNEQKQLGLKDNTYSGYSKIKKPVLLMRGRAAELPWARKAVNVLKGIIPFEESVTFKKLNHFAPVKEPDLIAQSLHSFFKPD